MRIGPRQLLMTKDPNGKFYYVEHKGASIEAGWKELEKLEEDILRLNTHPERTMTGNLVVVLSGCVLSLRI